MPKRKEIIYIEGKGHLKCTRCGEVKPTSEFHTREPYKDGTVKYRSHCIECVKKDNLDKYYRDYTDGSAKRRSYKYTLKTKYGLTVEGYHKMHEQQGGCCSICSVKLENIMNGEEGARCVVDHCHITGKVRALLCGPCNTGIGNLRDDPEIVEKALEYLRHHANM